MKRIINCLLLTLLLISCSNDNSRGCSDNADLLASDLNITSYSRGDLTQQGTIETFVEYSIDENNRIIRKHEISSFGSEFDRFFKFEYNSCGALSRIYSENVPNVLYDYENFEYDEMGRIVHHYSIPNYSFQYEYTENSVIRREYRSYNPSNNEWSLLNDKSEFIFGENNNISRILDLRIEENGGSYHYDSNGNLTEIKNLNGQTTVSLSYHNITNPYYFVMQKTFGSKQNAFLVNYHTGFVFTGYIYLGNNINLVKQYDRGTFDNFSYELHETSDGFATKFSRVTKDSRGNIYKRQHNFDIN